MSVVKEEPLLMETVSQMTERLVARIAERVLEIDSASLDLEWLIRVEARKTINEMVNQCKLLAYKDLEAGPGRCFWCDRADNGASERAARRIAAEIARLQS